MEFLCYLDQNFFFHFSNFSKIIVCPSQLLQIINPIEDVQFWGCLRMREGEVGDAKRHPPLLYKICHRYPTMMKLGTVIPHLKKFQKTYKSRDTPLEFC